MVFEKLGKTFLNYYMKSIVVLLFLTGIVLLIIGYINQIKKCPPPKIEYRYIPRTFEEQEDNPVRVSQLFSQMFEEPSTWIAGFKLAGNISRNDPLNKYNISDLGEPEKRIVDINQYHISQT